jgi:hypothetical protein
MIDKTIQLALKINIADETDADKYGIKKIYLDYREELEYQVASFNFPVDYKIPFATKLAFRDQLYRLYGQSLLTKFQNGMLFEDLRNYKFTLENILIELISFDVIAHTLELDIYVITTKYKVIDAITNTLFLKYPDQEPSVIVVSVTLDADTTIFSIAD